MIKSWVADTTEIGSSPTGYVIRVRLLLLSVRMDSPARQASREEGIRPLKTWRETKKKRLKIQRAENVAVITFQLRELCSKKSEDATNHWIVSHEHLPLKTLFNFSFLSCSFLVGPSVAHASWLNLLRASKTNDVIFDFHFAMCVAPVQCSHKFCEKWIF